MSFAASKVSKSKKPVASSKSTVGSTRLDTNSAVCRWQNPSDAAQPVVEYEVEPQQVMEGREFPGSYVEAPASAASPYYREGFYTSPASPYESPMTAPQDFKGAYYPSSPATAPYSPASGCPAASYSQSCFMPMCRPYRPCVDQCCASPYRTCARPPYLPAPNSRSPNLMPPNLPPPNSPTLGSAVPSSAAFSYPPSSYPSSCRPEASYLAMPQPPNCEANAPSNRAIQCAHQGCCPSCPQSSASGQWTPRCCIAPYYPLPCGSPNGRSAVYRPLAACPTQSFQAPSFPPPEAYAPFDPASYTPKDPYLNMPEYGARYSSANPYIPRAISGWNSPTTAPNYPRSHYAPPYCPHSSALRHQYHSSGYPVNCAQGPRFPAPHFQPQNHPPQRYAPPALTYKPPVCVATN